MYFYFGTKFSNFANILGDKFHDSRFKARDSKELTKIDPKTKKLKGSFKTKLYFIHNKVILLQFFDFR